MSFRRAVGLDSILENMSTFAITLFFLVLIGGFFVNPTGSLPATYKEAIQEPVGFIMPFYMACFGFVFSFFCVQFGPGPVPDGPVVKWLVTAPTRAGVSWTPESGQGTK